MILPIVKYPDPVLREKGTYIKQITPKIEQLVADMLETMYASGGVGLAAHQIGKALRVAVVDVSKAKRKSFVIVKEKVVPLESLMPLVLINATWSPTPMPPVAMNEGCLSFPDTYAEVWRYPVIDVLTQNKGKSLEFRCAGFLAQAIQHECDHLKGKLFVDYLSEEQRKAIEEKFTV